MGINNVGNDFNIDESLREIKDKATRTLSDWIADSYAFSTTFITCRNSKMTQDEISSLESGCRNTLSAIKDNTIRVFNDILKVFNINDDDIDYYFYCGNPDKPKNLQVTFYYKDESRDNLGDMTSILKTQLPSIDESLINSLLRTTTIDHQSDCIIARGIITKTYGNSPQYIKEYEKPLIISHGLLLSLCNEYGIDSGKSCRTDWGCEAAYRISSRAFKELVDKPTIDVLKDDGGQKGI